MPIRLATIADADTIAIVHVMARRETYAGILSARYLANQRVAEHAERWRGMLSSADRRESRFVATDRAGNIVGFASCGPQSRPAASFDGEIYGLYVLRRAQHGGLGRALIGAMARHLSAIGARSADVWVARDNLPARRFYQALGGELTTITTERHFDTWLRVVSYGWRDLSGLCKIGIQ